jgi:hypothetical protein
MPEFKIQEKPAVNAAQNPSQFKMIKNYVGGLAVIINPYDFSIPARRIDFKFDQELQYLPAKFAIGVFVSDDALRQMEKGYFTFENLEILIKMAEDLGYYVPDSIKEPKITLKELKNLLKKGDVKEMEKTLLNASSKIIGDFITLAKKMYSELNVSVVQYIEKKYQVSLEPINLDA